MDTAVGPGIGHYPDERYPRGSRGCATLMALLDALRQAFNDQRSSRTAALLTIYRPETHE